jgi:hypothetical protein
MKDLFILVHIISIGMALILVGVYAPNGWVYATYILFLSSLLLCEVCKRKIQDLK